MHITLEDILADVDPELMMTPEGRRVLTRTNPLLFAWLYLRHHITDQDGSVSFADCHVEWTDISLDWADTATVIAEYRHAFLAPRETGKTTWWYLILPIFWACHGYANFIAAFSHSDFQAQEHLKTFRDELDTNPKLKEDYPKVCRKKHRNNGVSDGDSKSTRVSQSGFIFMAKGIDTPALGMKVGNLRPDTILLDDIEPHEANYSLFMMEKRLSTLQNAILPLNIRARVVLTGTVTMFGSITHQLVKHNNGSEPSEWIEAEKFKIHHAKPILDNGDGTARSVWPEKWPLKWLESLSHTRSFKLNYENDPAAVDSEYWTEADFTHDDTLYTPNTYLSIDGAVTTKATSDYTGIAVVGVSGVKEADKKALVKFASHVKMKGAELRKYVLGVIELYPEIGIILIESNQGGDMWLEIFHDMPVRVVLMQNSAKKEERAGRLLNLYQRIPTRVIHTEHHTDLENEMMAFPRGLNDDMVDAVGNAVLRHFFPPTKPKAVKRQITPR